MKTRRAAPALLALVLAAVGCGSIGSASADDPDAPDALDGITWELTEGTGPSGDLVVPDGVRVTLLFAGDQVSGVSACNHYFGTAEIDAFGASEADVLIGGLGGTEMGCEPAVMALESTYLDTLGRVEQLTVTDDVLTVTGPDVELTFTAQPEVPTADLTDTTWNLSAMLDGAGPDGTASSPLAGAELRLDADGTLEVTTGCGGLTGRWVAEGDTVRLTEASYDDGQDEACMSDPQHLHVMEVVGDDFTAEVEGRTLTLRAANGGRGLQFHAAG